MTYFVMERSGWPASCSSDSWKSTSRAVTFWVESDPGNVYDKVKREYASRFDLEVMDPLGFNNTFAMVIRGETARRLNIHTLSEAAPYAAEWRPGFGYEFMERPDGYQGLVRAYHLTFGQPPRIMDLGLLYRALLEKQVDLVAGNSTDGLIAARDLAVLEDDKHYFPALSGRAHGSTRDAEAPSGGSGSAQSAWRENLR